MAQQVQSKDQLELSDTYNIILYSITLDGTQIYDVDEGCPISVGCDAKWITIDTENCDT